MTPSSDMTSDSSFLGQMAAASRQRVHAARAACSQVELLSRALDTPSPPRLRLQRRPPSLFDYQYEDFEFMDYQPYPAIRAPVAV